MLNCEKKRSKEREVFFRRCLLIGFWAKKKEINIFINLFIYIFINKKWMVILWIGKNS